ncbi:MAG: carboxypeptidase regulatory-like domain-containing protein, partial [Bacteroidota bacterium]
TFGWGLMNTALAAEVISGANASHRILQQSLSNGGTYNFSFYNDGSLPLKATLCWTDPAGTPNTAVLNQTSPRLVRDLDVRIIRSSDNASFLPWVLNLQSPQSPATRSDNIRDNVEQVLIDGLPQAGMYTVRVTHKGNIAPAQAFSLIVSGVSGLTAPNAILSGTVRYINTAQSPVRGVRVRVLQGNTRVDSTLTNTQGQFSFNLPPGTYTVEASSASGMPTPSSINASDALLASRHSTQLAVLSGLPLLASDVNSSGQTNGTDALQIQRFASMLQSSFARGAWVFSSPPTVTVVAGQTTTVNLQSVATGDVNASFSPQ